MISNTETHTPLGPIEWPTVGLLISNYCIWLTLTWWATELPLWLLVAGGGWTLALHGSLQHEALHGHPTRRRWLNTLLVWSPLTLWLPYTIYRADHLAHHRAARLTDPDQDTESYYVSEARWKDLPSVARMALCVNQTLVGRLLLGPWLAVAGLWRREVGMMVAGDLRRLPDWMLHLAGVCLLYWWISAVCGLPLWTYVLCCVWPGLSLTLLRSFYEHRPERTAAHSTALIEGTWLTRILFLNNNYHLIHHEHPRLPWYAIRNRYLQDSANARARNGGFYFPGYLVLARRYAWRMKDSPVYPGA